MSYKALEDLPEKFVDLYHKFRQELSNDGLKRLEITKNNEVVLFGFIKIFVHPITNHLSIQDRRDGLTWKPAQTNFLPFSKHYQLLNLAIIYNFKLYSKSHGEDIDSYNEQEKEDINAWLTLCFHDNKSLYVSLQKWTAKAILSILDKNCVKLANNYFQRLFTKDQYNYVVDNIALLAKLKSETPNLTPLIGMYIKGQLQDNKVDLHDLYKGKAFLNSINENVLHLIKKYLCNELRYVWMIDGVSVDQYRIQDREQVGIYNNPAEINYKLTDSGWRWLSKQSFPIIKKYIESDIGIHLFINIIALENLVVPFSFFEKLNDFPSKHVDAASMSSGDISFEAFQTSSMRRFIRLAICEAQIREISGDLERFCSMDFDLCWDWFQPWFDYPNRAICLPIAKNEKWTSLMRRQNQWHQEIRAQKELDDNACWNSLLKDCDYKGNHIKAITSTKELQQEGQERLHCVGSYSRVCVLGHSRIFGVTNDTERATVEITFDATKKQWTVSQVRGIENSEVSKKMDEVASYIAKSYTALSLNDHGNK